MRSDDDARSALSLLGLATRAGALVYGTGKVRDAVRAGTTGLVVVARDAAETQKRKVVPLLEARGVAYLEAFTKAELGGAIGRSEVAAIGVEPGSFADRLREILAVRDGRPRDRGSRRKLD